MLSIHLPAHMGHHVQPLTDSERVVAQYSPEWVRLVLSGATLRSGNVVTS